MPTIADIAAGLGLEAAGDLDLAITGAAHPAHAGEGDLALAMDRKFTALLAAGRARAAMTPPDYDWRADGLAAAIFAPRARFAMAGITTLFARPLDAPAGVHPTAVVDPSAELGADVSIGPFSVIGAGARIGDGALLLGQLTIGAEAEIGPGAVLHQGVRIGHRVRLGARVMAHPNAVIGGDGFSFVTPEPGAVEALRAAGGADRVAEGVENRAWARIHSLGAVVVGDDVEIGCGATIDRGTVADTRIGAGSKLDNQVQIGHNVSVGENCLLCGQVGVAGSAVLGDRVVIGGKGGVADHAQIGDDVMIMAASNVSGVVQSRQVMGGTPALPRSEATEILLQSRRLPRLARDVAALKKRFSDGRSSG